MLEVESTGQHGCSLYYVWPPEVAKTFEAEKFVVSVSQPTSIYTENIGTRSHVLFSERVAICCCPSVCRLSVTFVRPTQPVEIFGNVSTPFGTLALC